MKNGDFLQRLFFLLMLVTLIEKKMSFVTVKAVSDKLLLGKCVPCLRDKIAKVAVTILEFDTYILQHFEKEIIYYAHDPKEISKPGDTVLIRKREKLSSRMTHDLVDILYKAGDVVDPVTGKKCAGSVSRDLMKELNEKFGKLPSAFDYDKAPERGWQEGKKDITSKPVYIKYHQFNEDEEEHNDPYGI